MIQSNSVHDKALPRQLGRITGPIPLCDRGRRTTHRRLMLALRAIRMDRGMYHRILP